MPVPLPIGIVVGIIAVVLGAGVGVVAATRLSPEQRRVWLHRAVGAALALEKDANPSPDVLAEHVNNFLKLHHIPAKVTTKEVALVLADVRTTLPKT